MRSPEDTGIRPPALNTGVGQDRLGRIPRFGGSDLVEMPQPAQLPRKRFTTPSFVDQGHSFIESQDVTENAQDAESGRGQKRKSLDLGESILKTRKGRDGGRPDNTFSVFNSNNPARRRLKSFSFEDKLTTSPAKPKAMFKTPRALEGLGITEDFDFQSPNTQRPSKKNKRNHLSPIDISDIDTSDDDLPSPGKIFQKSAKSRVTPPSVSSTSSSTIFTPKSTIGSTSPLLEEARSSATRKSNARSATFNTPEISQAFPPQNHSINEADLNTIVDVMNEIPAQLTNYKNEIHKLVKDLATKVNNQERQIKELREENGQLWRRIDNIMNRPYEL